MKKFLWIFSLLFVFLLTKPVLALENYALDTAHSFIQFRIQHLGFSWLSGRFNQFDGQFNYDENNMENSSVEINIDTQSVDTNHAKRDKHLRSADFLDVDKYPKASFVSSSISKNNEDTYLIKGNLNLHGVSREIEIDAYLVGQGDDPWDNYRIGFEGKTQITLKDFAIDTNLGPNSQIVELTLSIEGIRQ